MGQRAPQRIVDNQYVAAEDLPPYGALQFYVSVTTHLTLPLASSYVLCSLGPLAARAGVEGHIRDQLGDLVGTRIGNRF